MFIVWDFPRQYIPHCINFIQILASYSDEIIHLSPHILFGTSPIVINHHIINMHTGSHHQKTRISPHGGQDTRSHSAKELEDVETELGGMPSHSALNIFQDEYQLGEPIVAASNQKQNRKNHIFIKMSARLNGIELSPDNMRASKVYQSYQENMRSTEVAKKASDKNINNSKVFQKIVEKQAEIAKLREENHKLSQANEELKGATEHRKYMRSTDRFYSTIEPRQSNNRIIRREQISNPLLQRFKIQEQLARTEEIKIHLQKRVIDLEAQVLNKEQAIKDLMKQSQHQVNLLYQNLSKRLKAKQVESYMNGKHLKQEKQKTSNLEKELAKMIQEKSIINNLLSQNKKQKERLFGTIKEQEDQLRKGKVVALRLEHCEDQLRYANEQLKRVKQQESVFKAEINSLKDHLSQAKRQLRDIISNPSSSSSTEALALRQSLSSKETQLNRFKEQSSTVQNMKKELEVVAQRYLECSHLLQQANEELIAVNLRTLNQCISKKSF